MNECVIECYCYNELSSKQEKFKTQELGLLRMLSMSFLFLLYFVSIRWEHFISVEYYGVTKVMVRRLELCKLYNYHLQ